MKKVAIGDQEALFNRLVEESKEEESKKEEEEKKGPPVALKPKIGVEANQHGCNGSHKVDDKKKLVAALNKGLKTLDAETHEDKNPKESVDVADKGGRT